jgi:hypothetical protein
VEEPTPLEKEAILLRWRSQHPEAAAEAQPSAEESSQLLLEIRQRVAGIESETLNMLTRSMRTRPTGGGGPMSRVLINFLFAPLAILAIIYLVLLLVHFL